MILVPNIRHDAHLSSKTSPSSHRPSFGFTIANSMASFESPRGLLVFPVELVHAITHEVSTQTAIDRRLRTNTLCTLSCVCRGFYFSARGQLLSAISFSSYLDRQSTQERAATLVRILQRDPTLLQTIRSVNLLVFKDPIVPFGTSLGLSGDSDHSIAKLLNLVLQSQSLEKLSIEGYFSDNSHRLAPMSRHLTWNQLNLNLQAILNGIQANSSLKSLKIVNVHKVPWNLLLPTSGSNLWRRLAFINASFEGPAVSLTGSWRNHVDPDAVSQSVGRTEVMTLLGFQHDFLSAIQFHLPKIPPSIFSHSDSFIHFKRLHTLRIMLPFSQSAANSLQNLLLGVANTLETIELRIHPRFGPSGLSSELRTIDSNVPNFRASRYISAKRVKIFEDPQNWCRNRRRWKCQLRPT